MRRPSPRNTATSRPRASARYSGSCSCWRNRVAMSSSANPRSISTTCCAAAATAAARSTSSSPTSSIQRQLLVLEEQGGDVFFGEPALNIHDLLRRGSDGRGMINLLVADKLITAPQLYSTFLLWLLAELFEQLPEVGDLDRPKLVFFFDEAHLLFTDTPKALQDKIEQVVRLIRSKGVGIYFVTQTPMDIPDDVLGQLGNRIQHIVGDVHG